MNGSRGCQIKAAKHSRWNRRGCTTPANSFLHCLLRYAIVRLPSILADATFSRKIDIWRSVSCLAALWHGDFIPRVGRAYRMSADFGQNRYFRPLVGLSQEQTACRVLFGLHRTRNTALYTEPGSTRGLKEQRQKTGKPRQANR